MKMRINIEREETGFVVSLEIGDIVAVINTHANYRDAVDEATWTCDDLGKYPNVRPEVCDWVRMRKEDEADYRAALMKGNW